MLDQNAEVMLVSPTFRSSWNFREKCWMYFQRDLPGSYRQLFKSQGLVDRTYVLWKLLVKVSLRSSQLSIMVLSKWSSHALA
jgi:hypothetical protein